jgi:hypothetical protein
MILALRLVQLQMILKLAQLVHLLPSHLSKSLTLPIRLPLCYLYLFPTSAYQPLSVYPACLSASLFLSACPSLIAWLPSLCLPLFACPPLPGCPLYHLPFHTLLKVS